MNMFSLKNVTNKGFFYISIEWAKCIIQSFQFIIQNKNRVNLLSAVNFSYCVVRAIAICVHLNKQC